MANDGDRPPLEGRVAVVTGGRAGRDGELPSSSARPAPLSDVTGRSTRGEPAPGYERTLEHYGFREMPGTIEHTAEEVTRRGGRRIPVRCDHTQEDEVRAHFARVEREVGQLDLLVNNAWGAHEDLDFLEPKPFWQLSIAHWDTMFARGVRNHFLSSPCAAPLLVRQGRGLIITITFWDWQRYTGHLFYDGAKAAMTRLAFALGKELRPHGIASVALSPGGCGPRWSSPATAPPSRPGAACRPSPAPSRPITWAALWWRSPPSRG